MLSAVCHSKMEWRLHAFVDGIGSCLGRSTAKPSGQQDFHKLLVVSHGRPMKGGPAKFIGGIHVYPRLKQNIDHLYAESP